MRGIVLVTLILCFLISRLPESSAFWWERKKKVEKPPEVEEVVPEVEEVVPEVEEVVPEVEEVVPKVEETEKPAVQVQEKEPEKKTDKEIKRSREAVEAQRALRERKRKQLNNTEWKIELTLLTGKRKKQSDSITFRNNQIASANLLRRGFSATNYTLMVQENGTVVWETMQTSQDSGIAFWRGEIDLNMEKMQGILSRHIDDKTRQNYSFMSINKKAIAPSPEE